jgi:uncharacterized membrane protein YfcA
MLESLPPLSALALAAFGLFAGGLVKGVVGIGLPLIAVPVIALVFPVPVAVSVLALPILGSNLLQTRQGVGPKPALERFWILILCLIVGILAGAQMLVALDEARLNLVLGGLLLGFVALQLLPLRIEVPPGRERPVGVVVGLAAGLVGGLSSFYGPLLVMFLMTLRLPKETFIPSIALLYLIGGSTLYASLAAYSFLTPPVLLASLAGFAPVYLGLEIGKRLRGHLDETLFMRAVQLVLAVIGLSMIGKTLI